MKRDPITKMYDKLTPKQQAALAFNHLLTGNEAETDKVVGAVRYKNYSCKDADFEEPFDSYRAMVLVWTIEYWQLYAQQLEALVRLNSYTRRKDWPRADQAHEQLEHLASCLSAIDRALRSVCEVQGIDANAVRVMAGCRSVSATAPDLAYESEVRGQLEGVISR
jgi:hypothetical protein